MPPGSARSHNFRHAPGASNGGSHRGRQRHTTAFESAAPPAPTAIPLIGADTCARTGGASGTQDIRCIQHGLAVKGRGHSSLGLERKRTRN